MSYSTHTPKHREWGQDKERGQNPAQSRAQLWQVLQEQINHVGRDQDHHHIPPAPICRSPESGQGFLPGPPSPHSARAHCSYMKGQKAGLGNCWSQPTCKKNNILLKHILTTAGTWSAVTDTRIFLWHYCLADQQGKLVTYQPFLSHPEWFNFRYFQTVNKFPSATFLTYFARLSKAF